MALSNYYRSEATLDPNFVPGTFIQNVNVPASPTTLAGSGVRGYTPPPGTENLPSIDPSLYLGQTAPSETLDRGFWGNAWRRGIQQSQATLWGGLGLAYDLAGNLIGPNQFTEGVRDWAYEGYTRNLEEAKQFPRIVQSLYDIAGPRTAAIWAAETVGEMLPSAATALIGAGAGGIAAKTIGANVIRSAAQKAVARTMAERGIGQAAATNLVAARLGGQAGAFFATAAMEGGGSWGGNVTELGMGNTNPVGDLTVGVVNGALELIIGAEASLLRRLTGKPATEVAERTFRQTLGQAILRDAGKEFTTESLQEITTAVNANLQQTGFTEILSTEDILNVFEAGISGLIGGVGFGGIAGLVDRKSSKPNSTTTPLPVVQPVDSRQQLELARVKGNEEISNRLNLELEQLTTNYNNQLQSYVQKETALKLERDILEGKASDTEGRFATLSKEQKAKAIEQRTKAVMQSRALQARVKEELENQLELKRKEFEPIQKGFDRDYQREYINQNRKEAKLISQSITSDPEVQDGVLRMSQDAQEVATRQGENLLAQISDENAKINRNLRLYEKAVEDAANGIKPVSPEYLKNIEKMLKNSEKRVKKLQTLRNSIRRIAKRIESNSQYMLDQDLTDFLNDIQELYSLSDVTEGQLYSFEDYINQDLLNDPNTSVADKQAHIRNQLVSFSNDNKRNEILKTINEASQYQSNIYEEEREIIRLDAEIKRQQQAELAAQENQWQQLVMAELGAPVQSALPEGSRATAERNRASLADLAQGPAVEDGRPVVAAQFEGREPVIAGTEEAKAQNISISLERSQNLESLRNLINDNEEKELGSVEHEPILDPDTIVASAETAQRQEDAGAEFVEGPTQPEAIREVTRWLRATIESLPLLKDRVSIVSSPSDVRLTREALNALADVEEANNTLGGMYDPVTGNIYIFANNIRYRQEAIRTLVHEAIVHFGIRSIMTTGQRLTFYSEVHRSFNDTTLWDNFIEESGKQYSQELLNDPVESAEEFVAWFTERKIVGKNPVDIVLTRKEASLWGRIKQFVHDVLKNLGLVRITENDIVDVVKASAQYLAANPKSLELQEQKAKAENEIILRFHDGTYKTVPIDPDSEQVWGTTFRDITHAAIYNSKLNKNTSGVPGVTIFTDIKPSETNTINATQNVNNQSAYVKGLLKYLIDEMKLVEIRSPDENTYQIVFGEDKILFETQDQSELAPFLAGGGVLNQITGRDVYDILAARGGKKSASNLLGGIGVFGLRHGNGKVTLFRALETALAHQKSDTPYFQSLIITPKFGNLDALSFDPISNRDKIIEPGELGIEEQIRLKEIEWKDTHNFATKIMSNLKSKGKALLGDSVVEVTPQDQVIEWLQDRYHSVRKIQAYLKGRYKDRKVINKKTNVYANLTGLTNSIHRGQSKLDRELVEPLRQAVSNLDLSSLGVKRNDVEFLEKAYEMLGLYSLAKHAAERNTEVQKRLRSEYYTTKDGKRKVRKVPEGRASNTELYAPSSMKSEDAAKWIEKLQGIGGVDANGNRYTIDDVMQLVYRINDTRLNLLVNSGFVSEESAQLMRDAYDYYVPLRLWEEFMDAYAPNYYAQKGGSGSISVGNKKLMRYATGRTDMPYNPVVMSVFQLQDTEAVILKNEVSRAVLELAKEDTANEIFQINKEEDTDVPFTIINVGGSLYFKKKQYATQSSGNIHIYVVDKDGKSVPIEVKDKWLGEALTGRNMAPVSEIVRHVGNITRFIASMSTVYSPAFIFTNPVKDLETALLNLGNVIAENESKLLIDSQASLRKNIVKDISSKNFHKMLRALTSENRTKAEQLISKNPELQSILDDWDRFDEYGAHTRMFSETNLEAIYKSMTNDIDSTNTLKRGINTIKKAGKFLDGLSDHTENMTRFSVFRNVKRAFEINYLESIKGQNIPREEVVEQLNMLNQKAANIALEITVNFTRKGTASPVINTLYAFSNATIQGSARIVQNLWRKGDTTTQNVKRVSSFIAVGVMGAAAMSALCRMTMGEDDDGINRYDKIPDYVKYLNFIVPIPGGEGKYFKIPLAYGYNIFWVLGTALDDAMRGNKSPLKVATDVVKESFGAFSPIDPTEGLANWVPTAFRPIAQIMENKTFTGTPIYPENTMQDLPDSMKTWANTPELYKILAQTLNRVTFGSEFKSGFIDVSPESIEHLVGSYFGGLGRVMTDTVSLMGMVTSGQQWDVNNLPVFSRFLATTNYRNTSSLYNQIADQVSTAKNVRDIIRTDKSLSLTDRQNLESKYSAELSLIRTYDSARRSIARLRKQEDRLLEKYPGGRWSRQFNEEYEKIQNQIERIMQKLLREANNAGFPLHQGG